MRGKIYKSCCAGFAALLLYPLLAHAETKIEFFDGTDKRVGVLLEYGTRGDIVILTDDGYVLQYASYNGSIRGVQLSFESDDCTGQPIIYMSNYGGFEELRSGGQIYGIWGSNKIVKVPWTPVLREVFPASYLDSEQCFQVVTNFPPNVGLNVELEDAVNYGMVSIEGQWVGFLPKLTAKPKQTGPIFCSGFENCPTN